MLVLTRYFLVALRIVVADDNPSFLRELVSALESDCEVIATAQDGDTALKRILSFRPEVAVLDLRMPALNAIDVTKKLSQHSATAAVVICSVENDPEVVDAALKAGVLGYVRKDRMNSDLHSAVKCAAKGQQFVSPR